MLKERTKLKPGDSRKRNDGVTVKVTDDQIVPEVPIALHKFDLVAGHQVQGDILRHINNIAALIGREHFAGTSRLSQQTGWRIGRLINVTDAGRRIIIVKHRYFATAAAIVTRHKINHLTTFTDRL